MTWREEGGEDKASDSPSSSDNSSEQHMEIVDATNKVTWGSKGLFNGYYAASPRNPEATNAVTAPWWQKDKLGLV